MVDAYTIASTNHDTYQIGANTGASVATSERKIGRDYATAIDFPLSLTLQEDLAMCKPRPDGGI